EDEAFKERLAMYFRRSASPGAAAALMRMNTQLDVRDVLPTIQAPTLVMHRTDDRDANVEEGRWIAAQIPGAKFVELPGDAHTLWAGNSDEVIDEIEEFLTGTRRGPEPDRGAGSGIECAERGAHVLKGVPGEWNLYAVAGR